MFVYISNSSSLFILYNFFLKFVDIYVFAVIPEPELDFFKDMEPKVKVNKVSFGSMYQR